ncbi:MAG TPA: hypothetical protein VIL65_12415 [Beijerinckiaceae bacterium]|jgi:hypothetical protein
MAQNGDMEEGLRRTLAEADRATGEAAEAYLPRYLAGLERSSERFFAARNPLSRLYHRWRWRHYRRLADEALEHIERAKAHGRGPGGLAPRR